MHHNHVDDDLTVSPQINVQDMTAIADAGFKTIICNRPDHESELQPEFNAIAKAAQEAGLKAHFQPIISGQMSEMDVAQFSTWFEAAEKPVFAYCRSGTRCVMLWALSQKDKLSKAEIMAKAERAGFNLTGLADRL